MNYLSWMKPQSWHRGATLAGVLCWVALGAGLTPQNAAAAPEGQTVGERLERSKQTEPSSSPVVPPLPENLPEAMTPDPTGIVGQSVSAQNRVGVGQLLPDLALESSRIGRTGADWLRGVALPLYVVPGGDHWGWLVNGWLMADGYDPIAIGRDAAFYMLETNEQLYTFPVLEIRDDGWMQLQYTEAGTVWVHESHLDLGEVSLEVETWGEGRQEASQIRFYRHGLSQPLRPAPAEGSLVALIAQDSYIEALEVRGDWMRVRVTQPSNGCSAVTGASTSEGWIRWRAGEKPLIWYPVRQC